MVDKINVDYNALQGNAFFDISKQLLTYYAATVRNIELDEKKTAGNVAVYGFVAHRRLLLNSITSGSDSDNNVCALFENTEKMLHGLGVKFEQIDEKLKNAIEQGCEASG